LGYIPVGALRITLFAIPVAIGILSTKIKGGLFMGSIFGISSLLTCIFATDAFGALLFSINAVYTILLCIVPRILAGLIPSLVFVSTKKHIKNTYITYYITGFFVSFVNTLFFVAFLLLLFSSKANQMQELLAGQTLAAFVLANIVINAALEIPVCTIFTGLIGTALNKANLIER
jgi:uncharacterized membrane protein